MPKSIRRVQNRAVLGRGVVLHSSAAVVSGKGILFLAPSGGGKSTTAEALARTGAEILGDDSTVVSRGTDGVWRMIPCAVFTWLHERRPPARRLHRLVLLEKGEHPVLKQVTPSYASYRILRESSIMSSCEMKPEENRILRETVRLLTSTFPVHLLRWSEGDSLSSMLSEPVE